MVRFSFPPIAVFFLAASFTLSAQNTQSLPSEIRAPNQEVKKEPVKEVINEQTSVTLHTVEIGGKSVSYKATTGTSLLKDEKGIVKGSLFYVAYTKEGENEASDRPLTFCFNGGPGSASIWLHMGLLGPKRTVFQENGFGEPPYRYIDNEYSILDLTDIVFIDPISTGYSRAAPGEDVKQFHGVDEDVKWVGEFIRLYTTHNGRWESPKFLAGESYGTTRAAALSEHLHEEYSMYLNGVILISSILDFITEDKNDENNDLPNILYLPSYASAAWYHKKLSPELQKKSLNELLKEVEDFALNDYALALLQGDSLSGDRKKAVGLKLASYTGLSPDYLEKTNLRISIYRFVKELLRNEERTIGRFDSRYLGIDNDLCGNYQEYDPSLNIVFGAFIATFYQYVRNDLKWQKDDEYKALTNVSPWNYGKATNRYLNVATSLKKMISRNQALRVFVACGYYDLATPYFAQEYTFNHMNLYPGVEKHLVMKYYEGGHMIYISVDTLRKMKKDLEQFFKETLTIHGKEKQKS